MCAAAFNDTRPQSGCWFVPGPSWTREETPFLFAVKWSHFESAPLTTDDSSSEVCGGNPSVV
jgi:hypothetical protein